MKDTLLYSGQTLDPSTVIACGVCLRGIHASYSILMGLEEFPMHVVYVAFIEVAII